MKSKLNTDKMEEKEEGFIIDFFELVFLVEACIPPSPIARAHFWSRMINKYYHELSKAQRIRLFEWISRNTNFQTGLKEGNEDIKLFYDRYNPENQYKVTVNFEGEKEYYEAFKHKNVYMISSNSSIIEEHIVKVEKII